MGKGGGVEAPTIDPQPAIDEFQKAADVVREEFPQIYYTFENAMGAGMRRMMETQEDALVAGMPYSDTALVSVNELRQMMGLEEMSQSAVLSRQMETLSNQLQTAPFTAMGETAGVTNAINVLQGRLERAENLRDPAARQAAIDEITQNITNFQGGLQYGLDKYYNDRLAFEIENRMRPEPEVATPELIYKSPGEFGALGSVEEGRIWSPYTEGATPGGYSDTRDPDKEGYWGIKGIADEPFAADLERILKEKGAWEDTGKGYLVSPTEVGLELEDIPAALRPQFEAVYGGEELPKFKRLFTEEELADPQWRELADIPEEWRDVTGLANLALDIDQWPEHELDRLEEYKRFLAGDLRAGLTNVGEGFEQYYTPEGPQTLSMADVQERLRETPGYQFQLGQGEQAMARSQAARGMLGSGQALLEAQQFGQGLAQNVYQSHLGRLAGLAGLNLPVQQQQMGQIGQFGGQTYAGTAGLAQTRQATWQQMTGAQAAAFNNAGQARLSSAQQNAQMQLQASIANQQAAMAGMGTMGGLLGGLFQMGSGLKF